MATFSWSGFVLKDALAGALVGLAPGQGESQNIDDISTVAGKLVKVQGGATSYMVCINGKKAYLDPDGRVVQSVPSGAYTVGTTMSIANYIIDDSEAGNEYTRTRSSEEGHEDYVHILNLEPKDNFAIQILSALLGKAENPVSFDDASIMMYARASYRWAQAMMQCAAEAREGDSSEDPAQTIEVNSGDLQSNTEKLLYNMAEYMKLGITQGIPVKGQTVGEGQTATPIQAKVTEVTEVKKITEITELKKITELPSSSGTQNVNVINDPSVRVIGSVDVSGSTVSVDNFPSQ